MMGMDWIWQCQNGCRKWKSDLLVVFLSGLHKALDQTVDWRYNIEFIRRKFRLQNLIDAGRGFPPLINERADIRAALTGLIPAFYMQSRNIFIIKV